MQTKVKHLMQYQWLSLSDTVSHSPIISHWVKKVVIISSDDIDPVQIISLSYKHSEFLIFILFLKCLHRLTEVAVSRAAVSRAAFSRATTVSHAATTVSTDTLTDSLTAVQHAVQHVPTAPPPTVSYNATEIPSNSYPLALISLTIWHAMQGQKNKHTKQSFQRVPGMRCFWRNDLRRRAKKKQPNPPQQQGARLLV